MKRPLNPWRTLVYLLTVVTLSTVQAGDTFKTFEQLPVLHQGRIMPLDSYARQQLLMVSGRSRLNGQSATAWLARCLFNPEQAKLDEIFLVNHPEVAEALGLQAASGRQRYSMADLEPVLPRLEKLARAAHQREASTSELVDQELVRLYASAAQVDQLYQACTFLMPQQVFAISDARLRKELGQPEQLGAWSLFELMQKQATLARLVETHRDIPRTEWTAYESELFRINAGVQTQRRSLREAGPAIFPASGMIDGNWLTPVGLFTSTLQASTAAPAELNLLYDMTRAFQLDQDEAFEAAAKQLYTAVAARLPEQRTARNLRRETRYHRVQPFYRAELLYGLAFLCALLSISFGRDRLYKAAWALLLLALLPHTYGIIARMLIMGRPPVTNLFSTFIFVAWICALLGLVLEFLQRQRLGLITASFSALALLLVSGRFAGEGDSMGVMVAVLDSNFWLATHVVCISLGYAGCCVAGLLGHMYLIQACFRSKTNAEKLADTLRTVHGTLAFGLIFSFFGTMLGGIWADQSWGRFWGWDPKENGALVIVLWSAILFHARLGGMIKGRGFAAGAVIGVIWVMLAWLGVNLLGVGLHSYGFTSNMARTLLAICVFEVLFVLLTVPFVKGSPQPD